jgi:hypothetical protein
VSIKVGYVILGQFWALILISFFTKFYLLLSLKDFENLLLRIFVEFI